MVDRMRFVVVQIANFLADERSGAVEVAFDWSSLQSALGLSLYLLISAALIFGGFWLYRQLVKVTSIRIINNQEV